MKTLETAYLTEFCPMLNNEKTIQGSLFQFWMHKCSKQQSNFQLLSTEKLTYVDDSTTKLAGIGEQDQQCSTGEVCWKY